MKNLINEAIDEWVSSGEYQYTNATYYLKKRLSNLWISINDRLPEIGEEVLIAFSDGDLMVGELLPDGQGFANPYELVNYKITTHCLIRQRRNTISEFLENRRWRC